MEAKNRVVQLEDLGEFLFEQAQQLDRLNARFEEVYSASREREDAEDRELGYRFDAYPKWLEASGWKHQGPNYRRTWPLLRRFLELERWIGAPVSFTLDQIADYLCCSRDTARRRLRELEELGVVSHTPGKGRNVSIARISHPIETPTSYSKVSWVQGGLADAPEGYLEEISGSKRQYALLYGVDLPAKEAKPTPKDSEGAKSPTGNRARVKDSDARPDAERQTEDAQPTQEEPVEGRHTATSEVATCYPLETKDKVFSIRKSLPSDTREDGKRNEGKPKARNPIEEVEKVSKNIALEDVGQEAIEWARRIVAAFGNRDNLLAARAAQLSEHLLATGRQHLLGVALPRIRRCARTTEIVYPIRYLIAALLDVEKETTDDPAERCFGQTVLEGIGETRESDERRGAEDARRSYGWFFGEATPPEVETEQPGAKEQQARHKAAKSPRGYGQLSGSAKNSEVPPEPPCGAEGPTFKNVLSSPKEAWRTIVADFFSEGDPGVDPGFFDRYEGYSVDDGVLTVAAPSSALRDAIIERFGSEFGRLWRLRAGCKARILVGALADGEELAG